MMMSKTTTTATHGATKLSGPADDAWRYRLAVSRAGPGDEM